jgi:hypothetical protein
MEEGGAALIEGPTGNQSVTAWLISLAESQGLSVPAEGKNAAGKNLRGELQKFVLGRMGRVSQPRPPAGTIVTGRLVSSY